MDTLSRDSSSSSSVLPKVGVGLGALGLILSIVALVKLSTLQKTVAEHSQEIPKIATLEGDLRAATTKTENDLRGLRETTPDGARRLGTLLASGSAPTLRFVLIDPNTPADLLAIVKASPGRRLTLGANLPAGVVDVAVATPAERDQQAVAALDSGRPLESLLETRQEKVRYDESSMVRDHAKGLPIPDAPPELEPEPGKADANSASTVTAEAPLVDRVLERALHLHRALRAIRRI